jgi:anti-anti-sigma factor
MQGPAAVAGDFTGQGHMDVAVAINDAGEVWVLLRQPDGSFSSPLRFPTGGIVPDALVARDFDGDGRLDLAGVSANSNLAFLLLGNGDGTFRGPLLLPSPDQEPPLIRLPGGGPEAGLPTAGLLDAAPAQSSGGLSLLQVFLAGSLPPRDPLPPPPTEEALPGAETSRPLEPPTWTVEGSWQDSGAGIANAPFADVFVVGGPGLPAGVDLFSVRGAEQPPGAVDEMEGKRVPSEFEEESLSMSDSTRPLTCDVENTPDRVVMRLTGDDLSLGEQNLRAFEKLLRTAAADLGERELVVDFRNVEFISSDVLGVLLRMRQSVKDQGGTLSLQGLRDRVYEVFAVTRLNSFFSILPDPS